MTLAANALLYIVTFLLETKVSVGNIDVQSYILVPLFILAVDGTREMSVNVVYLYQNENQTKILFPCACCDLDTSRYVRKQNDTMITQLNLG